MIKSEIVVRVLNTLLNSSFLKALNTTKDAYPANIYLLKVNNGNIRKWCEMYSKLLTLNIFHTF